MSYMEPMYEDAREYIYKHIDMYQRNCMDELAILLSVSDKIYEKRLTEVRDWEDEMLLFLDEEQVDGFLPLQDKIEKKLQETFLQYVVYSSDTNSFDTGGDVQAEYDVDGYNQEYDDDEYDEEDDSELI